ncbi:Disintegrin and metalloproteinase domain-containing protein 10 [Blomia tropicalis]|nr:Disintegrin and metalloproteinase domain-containing protein 10 [Blomia tropicalis]
MTNDPVVFFFLANKFSLFFFRLDGACGADPEVRAWMDQIANSAVVDEPDNNDKPNNRTQLNRTKRSSNFYHNYRIPSEAQGRISYSKPTNPPQPSSPTLPSRRACSLYIQTDTFLWDHVKKHESEKSDFKVREEIASLVAQHIKAVNHIYETSIFKDIIGLKFIVQRLRINDSSSCDIHKREHNQFCSPNIDVSNFLNLNSQFNHNDFCLAYIFTYRDFSGGTLGLAWVASTSVYVSNHCSNTLKFTSEREYAIPLHKKTFFYNIILFKDDFTFVHDLQNVKTFNNENLYHLTGASGGICEKYKTYTENIGGRQVQTKRSLNTGIITFVNYNSRVPPKVSELTLAHEIGHNFGSPHDYPAECRPGGPMGNFIMYSSATSGERQNNNKFSHCSVNNISSVLHAVFSNEGKENCFQEDNGPFCGNKIVEEGEECDCGYDSRECNEDCCYPRNVDEFKLRDPYAQPCRRRPGSYCSPSEGPCCTERCTFEGETKQCRDVGECTYKSLCDGQRAHCPLPPAKPNKTECNMGTQVCWRGSCTGSICQKYDLEECFLTAKRGSKSDEMCEVACQRRSQPETCRRTSEIEKMKNISGLRLRPGSPCNDFQGYCDVFQRCRPVDAEGPLARLKNLLFNKKTLISIKQWVTTYWWACTLVMFGAMLVMAAFIKCCAVHTPSSNPKRKKALRLSETLRRPADTLRRKSRDRLNGQSRNGGAGAHGQRSSREHGNGRNGHRSDGSRSQSSSAAHHNSSSSASSQQLPLTNIHHTSQAAPSSSSQSSSSNHVRSGYPNHPSVPTSSSVNANNNNINNHSQSSTTFPPTLVVNLPPAKEMNLPQQPFDPPPPYPGIPKPNAPPLNIVVSPSINGGPSHGYGEGRGHYNRHGQTNVPTSAKIPGLSKGGHGNGKLKGDSESKSRRS